MTAADEVVGRVVAQLTKAKGEIDAEMDKLRAAGVSEENLAGLQAISQSLDDVNPDPVVEEPEEPVEEPVEPTA